MIPPIFPPIAADSVMTRYLQIMALVIVGTIVLGAVAVMVVIYANNPNATLPPTVVSILSIGLGFALHAMGSTQGATQTQSAAQQAVGLVTPNPGLSQGRGGPGGAGGQGGAGGIGGLPDESSGASGVNGVNDPAGGPHA